jgi:hypothetical protein
MLVSKVAELFEFFSALIMVEDDLTLWSESFKADNNEGRVWLWVYVKMRSLRLRPTGLAMGRGALVTAWTSQSEGRKTHETPHRRRRYSTTACIAETVPCHSCLLPVAQVGNVVW